MLRTSGAQNASASRYSSNEKVQETGPFAVRCGCGLLHRGAAVHDVSTWPEDYYNRREGKSVRY